MNLVDRRTLVDVELLLLAQAKQQAERAVVDEREQSWRNFLEVAPQPLVEYVLAVDADIVADRQAFDADSKQWFWRNHPLFEHVLEGLRCALYDQSAPGDRLGYVQARMLKYAEWALAWAYARQRQPLTGGVHYDHVVQELAARDFLAWSMAESHVAWQQPELYLERWRVAATRDVETLEQAGLHAAELAFLAAYDDDSEDTYAQ